MGYTKEQFVIGGFEEIGFASYAYDLQPEQLNTALRRLDAMLAEWYGKGIRIGYPMPRRICWTLKAHSLRTTCTRKQSLIRLTE